MGTSCRHRDRDAAAAVKAGRPRITIDLDPTDDPTHGQQGVHVLATATMIRGATCRSSRTVTFNDEPAQFAGGCGCCGRATRPPRGGRGGSCGACSQSCARRFPQPPSGCGWTGALPTRNCSGSSSSSRSSTSWRWPATRAWRSARGRLMGKARMRPRPPVRRRICMGRRGMPHGAGSASAG